MKRDVNDLHREQGPDAVRAAFDKAPRKTAEPKDKPKPKGCFVLVPFNAIKMSTAPNYLVKGIIPRGGLIVIWGPPKCGKSFWTFDLMMHVALGWKYRGHRVRQGVVVYLALEGGYGFPDRVEAWRQRHLADHQGEVPFYLVSTTIDLVKDHPALIADIRAQIGDARPEVVVIDTLNRSLVGDENSSEDMAKYIRAADAIRTTFNCAAIIVHHCGVQGNRPRGHTSLTGADDAQIAVERGEDGTITVKIEHMKDGPDGGTISSRLERVELGNDDEGDPKTSMIVVPVEGESAANKPAKLSDSDLLALDALRQAMGKHAVKPIPQSGTFWVCPVEVWREHFYAVKDGDRDTKKKAFQRARERLQLRGIIATWEDAAWLTGHAGHGGTFAGHVPQDWSGTPQGDTLKGVPRVPPSLSQSDVPAFRVIGLAPGATCICCNLADDGVMKIRPAIAGTKTEPLHPDCGVTLV